MVFLTDRKRATGMGTAKTGTAHFWGMTVSSVALLILVPLFIFTVGPMLGENHATVTAYFSHPLPAIVALLTFIVGLLHFKNGVTVLIEDYFQGLSRKIWIIVMTCGSYAAIATAVFAIARIAL
jgi:succinate dehydrogenase / fumarate reductase membrane anchor subunit